MKIIDEIANILIKTAFSVLKGTLVVVLNIVSLVLTIFWRSIPGLLNLIYLTLQAFFIVSYRCYRYVLTITSWLLFRHLGINPFSLPLRLMASLMFSLGIGCIVLNLTDMALLWPVIGVSASHGLIIGLAWDRIESPDGLQLGVVR